MPLANPRPTDGRRDNACVIVFARAPVPGRCKTRLARGCGNRRAAGLYRAMLEHAVACIAAERSTPVALFAAPDTRHPCFARLRRRYGVQLLRQPRGDLGQRMHRACRWGLARYRRVILIGTDQPCLHDDWLDHARGVLATKHSAWLAPTRDGGFWGLGLATAPAGLFRGQRWSTARVARVTRRRMHIAGLTCRDYPLRADVDEQRDWQALPATLRTRLARRACLPGLSIIVQAGQ